MTALVILAVLVLLPLAGALLLRSNGAVAFLSACFGSVLAAAVAPDVADFITGFSSFKGTGVEDWTRVALVALPLLIALFVTRKSVGMSKQLFNLIPALAAGLLLALFVVPVLPAALKDVVTSNKFWDTLLSLETAVLLVGALAAYALFLMLHPHHKEDDRKRK